MIEGASAGSGRADRPSRQEFSALTAAPIPCRWCGRACRLKRGGSPRVFCTSGCRTAFHTAARRWAEQAVASGMLTIAELRSGDPAACTLAGEGKSPVQVGKAIDLLGELLDDAFPGELLGALSVDTLDRIAAYLDEPLNAAE